MSENLIVTGCVTDCKRLISNFVRSTDSTSFYFIDFAKEWRKLHFELIFCGREKSVELPEFTRELFTIVKKMLLLDTATLPEKIGALFLMYSLYYKQQSYAKFRFTLHEFHNLLSFMDSLRSKGHEDAEFTFVKLFTDNAFHYTASSSEYINLNLKANSLEEEVKKDEPTNQLFQLFESNNFHMLEVIHSQYIHRKKMLPELPTQKTSPAAVNEKCMKKIKSYYINMIGGSCEKVLSEPEQDDDSEDDIGGRRQEIKGRSFQTVDEYRLPGSSTRGKRGARGKGRGTRGTGKKGRK